MPPSFLCHVCSGCIIHVTTCNDYKRRIDLFPNRPFDKLQRHERTNDPVRETAKKFPMKQPSAVIEVMSRRALKRSPMGSATHARHQWMLACTHRSIPPTSAGPATLLQCDGPSGPYRSSSSGTGTAGTGAVPAGRGAPTAGGAAGAWLSLAFHACRIAETRLSSCDRGQASAGT